MNTRRIFRRAVIACLEIVGLVPRDLKGWFVARKSNKVYDVRPGTHDQFVKEHPDKIGVDEKTAELWLDNGKAFDDVMSKWMRADTYGNELTFQAMAPLSRRDLENMQDFAATHRSKNVVIESPSGLTWRSGDKTYAVPWKEFMGIDKPSSLRGYAA